MAFSVRCVSRVFSGTETSRSSWVDWVDWVDPSDISFDDILKT